MPAQLQACIFSFDEGTQSWAKLLSLLGEIGGAQGLVFSVLVICRVLLVGIEKRREQSATRRPAKV